MIALKDGTFWGDVGVEISGLTLAQGLALMQVETPGYTLEGDEELAAILAQQGETLADLHRDGEANGYCIVVRGTEAKWQKELKDRGWLP